MKRFEGIMPAAITPFDEDGKFLEESFERLLSRCYAAGVHGVYATGQTGEGLQQSAAQRKQVAEAAVKYSPPGKTVIVHTGAMSTAEAVDLTRHAADIGAHAVSALPPIGNYSFEEIKAYYTAIASASDVPLLVYYFPSLAPKITTVQQVLELCDIPNVIGLKFTDSDLFKLSEVKRFGATVFFGTDEMLIAGLVMGADGGIGSFYNVMPELFVRAYEMTQNGEWEQARVLQSQINEIISIALHFPVHPVIKVMMRQIGIDCGKCLPPRRSLTASEEADLLELLGKSEVWQSIISKKQTA